MNACASSQQKTFGSTYVCTPLLQSVYADGMLFLK